ncbi:hypothetical protein ABZ938_30570 [Streptomyces sp. NPDC046409]|uniref:hypothetical protein n=1 Tax=Streptomyces sp. NPDC046409 TaxID=3156675 RepID=UPI00340517C1
MVIIRPAIPSEMVKLDPMEVSNPIGRISVVTIEKIPSITEITASHETSGDRAGSSAGSMEAVVAVDTNPVLLWGFTDGCEHYCSRDRRHLLAVFRRQQEHPGTPPTRRPNDVRAGEPGVAAVQAVQGGLEGR